MGTPFLDTDGTVIVAVIGSSRDEIFTNTGEVIVALRRITNTGQIDAGFGIGPPSVNPPSSSHCIRLTRPASTGSALSPLYHGVSFAGIIWIDDTLYLVGTGFAGGGYTSTGLRKPEYPTLLITRWTGQGQVDRSVIPSGYEEGGTNPFQYWYAKGIHRDGKRSFLIYGAGGTPRTKTSQLPDGTTITETLVTQPGPALFRVNHPSGLDMTFGDHGAAVIRIPELYPSVIAGGGSLNQCTLAYADLHQYRRGPIRSTFGGAARFK